MKKRKSTAKYTLLFGILLLLLLIHFVFAANPVGPDSITINSNETKGASSAQMINISGGRILSMNVTATTQDPRWKAFVGNVIGSFTLDDGDGATIYNWTLSSITGRIYATRNDSTISWGDIGCATTNDMETENVNMNHTNSGDNITATFSDTTHDLFWVGSTSIGANLCPTLNTYVNNATQDNSFEEMVLDDGSNIVYATIIEENETAGYDGEFYDFQMIVPENGAPSFTGATAYYLYVEIGT